MFLSDTDVNQVAFDFPTYTQLRCIPRDPSFTDVSRTNPVFGLRIINLVSA